MNDAWNSYFVSLKNFKNIILNKGGYYMIRNFVILGALIVISNLANVVSAAPHVIDYSTTLKHATTLVSYSSDNDNTSQDMSCCKEKKSDTN